MNTDGTHATIELVLTGKPRDIGGFSVTRVLPAVARRHVGPFVFVDHFGPVAVPPGMGMDVRPHPHVALATITYLFEGEIFHRDSLGNAQAIRPGEVNWMIAGRGIVHSERTPPEVREKGGNMHGLQCWVALPLEHEDTDPQFSHIAARDVPVVQKPKALLRVVAGTAYGVTSPTPVLSPTLYVHALLEAGAEVPVDDTHEERAFYVLEGSVQCAGETHQPGTMVFLGPGTAIMRALGNASVMLMGGTHVGPRFIEWNFVGSTKERIERAKDDWRAGRFPKVPGNEVEFIPLP